MQGICHLLTNIGSYCKESASGYPPYEYSSNDPIVPSEFENMDLENFVYEKVSEDFAESSTGIGRIAFRRHCSEPVEGNVTASQKLFMHARLKFL